MPLEVKLADLLGLELVDPFEAEHEDPKQIAKRLTKAGLIENFNFKKKQHLQTGASRQWRLPVSRCQDAPLHRVRQAAQYLPLASSSGTALGRCSPFKKDLAPLEFPTVLNCLVLMP